MHDIDSGGPRATRVPFEDLMCATKASELRFTAKLTTVVIQVT
jgi:hypothetical protein